MDTPVGAEHVDQGDTAAAREHLTGSLLVCRDIGTRIGIARGLESFAALAVREDEPERAVLFAAAATALRETAGLPPLSGARAERYLAPRNCEGFFMPGIVRSGGKRTAGIPSPAPSARERVGQERKS